MFLQRLKLSYSIFFCSLFALLLCLKLFYIIEGIAPVLITVYFALFVIHLFVLYFNTDSKAINLLAIFSMIITIFVLWKISLIIITLVGYIIVFALKKKDCSFRKTGITMASLSLALLLLPYAVFPALLLFGEKRVDQEIYSPNGECFIRVLVSDGGVSDNTYIELHKNATIYLGWIWFVPRASERLASLRFGDEYRIFWEDEETVVINDRVYHIG